jgi:hypothetical protein
MGQARPFQGVRVKRYT